MTRAARRLQVRGVRGLRSDGAGRLTLGGARYLLVRPETLIGVQKAMERTLGPRANDCLVAGGHAGGARAAGALRGGVSARVRRLAAIGTRIGWGDFRIGRLNGTDFSIAVRRSPFADAYGPARRPVCHLLRGVLESVAAALAGCPRVVVETTCAATGARLCRFETQPATVRGAGARRENRRKVDERFSRRAPAPLTARVARRKRRR